MSVVEGEQNQAEDRMCARIRSTCGNVRCSVVPAENRCSGRIHVGSCSVASTGRGKNFDIECEKNLTSLCRRGKEVYVNYV